MKIQALRIPAAATAALVLLAACASTAPEPPPAPIERRQVKQVTATVTGVHATKRLVSLQRPDGKFITVEVGPEVQNFDQIHVGDKVVASYFEAIGFELVDPNTPRTPDQAGVIAGRAAPGQRPEGALGGFIETTVTIQSVDTAAHTVTFKGEDGLERTVFVEREDGRAFASRLRPGDRVLVTYTEAIAISVVPGQ